MDVDKVAKKGLVFVPGCYFVEQKRGVSEDGRTGVVEVLPGCGVLGDLGVVGGQAGERETDPVCDARCAFAAVQAGRCSGVRRRAGGLMDLPQFMLGQGLSARFVRYGR